MSSPATGLPEATETADRFKVMSEFTEWNRRYAFGWKAAGPDTATKVIESPNGGPVSPEGERIELLKQGWIPNREQVLCVTDFNGDHKRCTYAAFRSYFDRQRISDRVTIPRWVPEFWRSRYLTLVVGEWDSRFPIDWPLCA